jgi:hypothetical protein
MADTATANSHTKSYSTVASASAFIYFLFHPSPRWSHLEWAGAGRF